MQTLPSIQAALGLRFVKHLENITNGSTINHLGDLKEVRLFPQLTQCKGTYDHSFLAAASDMSIQGEHEDAAKPLSPYLDHGIHFSSLDLARRELGRLLGDEYEKRMLTLK